MKRAVVIVLAPLALLATGMTGVALPPADQRNFLACPLIRDTEPTPCWLAEYEGELYYLGLQQDTEAEFFPPQQMHKALIEGRVDPDGKRLCGGLVLHDVRASTMPDIYPSCQTVLPAEGHVAPPARRGALPRNTGDQLATDPIDTRRPRPPLPDPVKPYQQMQYLLPFDFDGEFMVNKVTRPLTAAWQYALKTRAKEIDVLGQRGQVLLSNGERLVENPRIARQRAEKIAEALRDLGVRKTRINVRWVTEPLPPNGRTDFDARIVLVTVKP